MWDYLGATAGSCSESIGAAAEIERRGRLLSELAIKVWPALEVSPEVLKASRRTELHREASRHSLDQVSMSDDLRRLYDHLRPLILGIDPHIIEVPRPHSVSYYADDGDYFLEVLPRKWKLILLMNLTLSECTHRDEFLSDATDYKFIVNAEHVGGVIYRL